MADNQGHPVFPQPPLPSKSLKHFSCALCHRRKVKCDKKDPCTYCVTHRVPCVPAAPTAPRPRKKRFPEAELLARLRRYEAALKSYGADLDSINSKDGLDFGKSSPRAGSDLAAPEADIGFTPPKQEPEEENTWPTPQEELLKAGWLLKNPSDDENEESPIIKTYNEMFPNDGSNVLFGLTGTVDLGNLHPSPVEIFRLWQIFIDNVNPLLRLFHVPTMQQQILRAASDLKSASLATHALLFGIYCTAICSLEEEDCVATLGDEKMVLMARYSTGVVYALQTAGFLRSNDLTVLQAFLLYLQSTRYTMDPRSLFSMTGILYRLAKRNGYHRNICPRGVSVFEQEMRKRLWWQIVLLETRTAEMSGSGTAGLDYAWNTNLPLNVNDSDLAPELKALPQEFPRATDMLFVLVRCEIAEFFRQVRVANNNDLGLSEFSNPTTSTQSKIKAIESLERHLQEKYLQYCDPQIPTHILAKSYAVYAIGKAKLVSYLIISPKDDPSLQKEILQKVMDVCIEAIDDHTNCRLNPAIRPFMWFIYTSVPVLAYVHLMYHLRQITTGELADRAWAAVTRREDILGRPPHMKAPKGTFTTMQFAFASVMMKAWEAREAALRDLQIPVETPVLVGKMKEILAAGPTSRVRTKSPEHAGSPEEKMAALHISPSDSNPATFLPQPPQTSPAASSSSGAAAVTTATATWSDFSAPSSSSVAGYPSQPNFVPDLNFMTQGDGGYEFLPASFDSTAAAAAAVAAPMQFLIPEDDINMWDWDAALSNHNPESNHIDWGQALSTYR